MTKKLIKLNLESGNGFPLESVFLANEKEVNDLLALNGHVLDFVEDDGEYTHSGVVIAISDNNIEDIGETAVEVLEQHVGAFLRGVCITDYIHLDEIFYSVALFVRENYKTNLTDKAIYAVDKYIAKNRPEESKYEDGFYSEWYYEDIVRDILWVTDLQKVNRSIDSGESNKEVGKMVSKMVLKRLG